MKTIARRGVNGGKVIEESFVEKFERWHHNKRMNSFIIYAEKLPYLQSSSLFLLQKKIHGYRSFKWYSLIRLPFSNTFMHTTPLREKIFNWSFLCKLLHLSHIYLQYVLSISSEKYYLQRHGTRDRNITQ